MKLDFRATGPEEEGAIRSFLAAIFELPLDAPLVNSKHMQWKYYQRREDWSRGEGSRSFVYTSQVYTNQKGYSAHGCAWPFRVLINGTAVGGVHPIDWAAGSDIPGLGALLLRQMRTLEDISCCLGGTVIAQKVIAQTGYRPSGEIKYYSRPLHVWRQFISHSQRDIKLPARLIRNFLWSQGAGAKAPKGWTAEQIAPEQLPSEVFPQSSATVTACERSAELFRYFQDCPTARHKLYLARRDGQPAGYFFLSFPPGEARIADSWVVGDGVEDWKALYALAVHTAHKMTRAGEISACSALKRGQEALRALRFRTHLTLPVMLFDPKKRLAGSPPIHFQMIDNDFSFLHQGKPDYQT